ncbi:MAG: DUF4331 family protein [Saprospiraceae bacterium]|nr:DUF4331 family protein [Saprospiraceae bacterium]
MKNLNVAGIAIILFAFGILFMSADHIDAPAVSGSSADITDFYAFQGENASNLVFVANLNGLLSPEMTTTQTFDENVLVEFNIDNDGDYVEDLVIQAIPRNGKMYVFGPTAPASTGKSSTVIESASQTVVDITKYSESPISATNAGVTAFAGPRDDPFFMDFAQYGAVVGGMASGFNDPGSDTFAGTNVMSIVVEVDKSLLGGNGSLNTWVETKTK